MFEKVINVMPTNDEKVTPLFGVDVPLCGRSYY
jgi:hypothetical protein